MEGRWTKLALRIWAALILLFLFIPILLIFFYAFNTSNIESWPIAGLTFKWFMATWNDSDVRSALVLSLQAGLAATALAPLAQVTACRQFGGFGDKANSREHHFTSSA